MVTSSNVRFEAADNENVFEVMFLWHLHWSPGISNSDRVTTT